MTKDLVDMELKIAPVIWKILMPKPLEQVKICNCGSRELALGPYNILCGIYIATIHEYALANTDFSRNPSVCDVNQTIIAVTTL
jgi:hypothetical protein